MKYTVDHEQLSRSLIQNRAAADASESQGILCGILCAEGRADEQSWVRQVMGEEALQGDVLANECVDDLDRLYRESIEQMNDPDMGFQLFLPEEDDDIDKTVGSVSEWCQGFLFGFSLSGMLNEKNLPAEVREIIDDFIEITKVNFENSENPEEDEQALTEIIEYVRMGVLYIFEELQPLENTSTIH